MITEPSVQASASTTLLTVRIAGDMDYGTAPFLRNRLVDELTQVRRGVVLDLGAMSFCDSAGLSVLLGAWRRAEQAGAVLVLACVPPTLQRRLRITGMDTVLHVCDTVTEATNTLAGGAARHQHPPPDPRENSAKICSGADAVPHVACRVPGPKW